MKIYKVQSTMTEYAVFTCEVVEFSVTGEFDGAKQELQYGLWWQIFTGSLIECEAYIRLAEKNQI
jgi:hypothetical protein